MAQKRNRVGEAELFRMTKWKSCIETLPAPAPVPCEDVPSWVAPQLNDSISISPACLLVLRLALDVGDLQEHSRLPSHRLLRFLVRSGRTIPAELTLITTTRRPGDMTAIVIFDRARPAAGRDAIARHLPAAGGGSSATRRSETVSSSSWKCGRRKATAL